MEHIKTVETRNLCESAKNGGCGECQTSCQSACKTSCGIANQQCESTGEQVIANLKCRRFRRHFFIKRQRRMVYDTSVLGGYHRIDICLALFMQTVAMTSSACLRELP